MYYGSEDHQTVDQSCLGAGQSPWVRAWTAVYRLYAHSVCDTKAPLQLQYVARGAIYV